MSREERWKIIADAMGHGYATKDLSQFRLFGTPVQQAKQRHILECVGTISASLDAMVAIGRNVMFYGPRGTGKDFMMANLARKAVLGYGMKLRWRNGVDLFSSYRSCMNPKSELTETEFIAQLTEIQILAISDLLPPSGPLTEFQAGLMFSVIDSRYRQGKPTWLTLNVDCRKTAEDRMGAQIVDRLLHHADSLFCEWSSYREFGKGNEK